MKTERTAKLFVHEDGENYSLWVHPDLPNRDTFVHDIEASMSLASLFSNLYLYFWRRGTVEGSLRI